MFDTTFAPTALRDRVLLLAAQCQHAARTAAVLAGDTVASVMECDDCGHQTQFTDADYAFCNTRVWIPAARRPFVRRAYAA